jgi:hypothetical protein
VAKLVQKVNLQNLLVHLSSEVFAFNTTNIFSCVPPPPVALQKFISHHNLQMLRRATVKALQASTGHLSEKQPSIT